MSIFIKESYVWNHPVDLDTSFDDDDFERRWVVCECGNGRKYMRCEDVNDEPIDLIRFFKVDGVQTCEVCLEEMKKSIEEALE